MKLRLLSLALVMGAALSFSPSAFGQILLDIDLTNASTTGDVLITATGTNPSAADSSTTSADGVDLLGFFTQDVGTSSPLGFSGTLKVPGSQTYNSAITDDLSSGAYEDLNLYYESGSRGGATPTTQTFATNSAAFTGLSTVNLSSYLADLPMTLGATGSIESGYSEVDGAVIGEWEVTGLPVATPEPSTWALMLCGLGLLAFLRLRMRQKEIA